MSRNLSGGRFGVFINSDGVYKPSQVSTYFGVWMGSSEYSAISAKCFEVTAAYLSTRAPILLRTLGKQHSFQGTLWII